MSDEGEGCVFYVKRLLTDMKDDGWFESDSEPIKKNFDTLNSLKKGTEIGADCFIEYGIGTFY